MPITILPIDLGTYANDGTGDDLRRAFEKVNANFSAIDSIVATNGVNLGTGAPIFRDKLPDPDIGDLLRFRSIKQGTNVNISFSTDEITIGATDSINNLVEDISPQLGGDLDLNNYDLTGVGSISIDGNIVANYLTGILTGNVTGNLTGNVTGNLTGNVTGNVIGNVTGDTTGLHTGNVDGNVEGNLNGNTTGTHTGSVIGNVSGNTTGIHYGNVEGNVAGNIQGIVTATAGSSLIGSVTGDVTGNLTGNVTGNVTGNLTGNAGTVTNGVYTTSSINALFDVDTASILPEAGQALIWDGSKWIPADIPTGGGGGTSLDFGTFTIPDGPVSDFGTFV